jgi:muramoyltetrapeptide carboxypeptidase
MFARSADAAAAEINRALADPTIRAVVALRGGYGSMRLLPRLDCAQVERGQALLVGFSDVTALHHAWVRAGVCSVHGTMAEALVSLSAAQFHAWRQVLAGAVAEPQHGLVTVRAGHCVGRVLGGNLSLLAALACTPWAMPIHGSVLFIEDVSESPYRVDRMLTSLQLAGWWDRVSAVIIGSFHDCQPADDGVTVERVLEEHFSSAAFPVLLGYPSGHFTHGDAGRALRFGDWAQVDGQHGTVWFSAGDGPPP